jgi:hypothetical protein
VVHYFEEMPSGLQPVELTIGQIITSSRSASADPMHHDQALVNAYHLAGHTPIVVTPVVTPSMTTRFRRSPRSLRSV